MSYRQDAAQHRFTVASDSSCRHQAAICVSILLSFEDDVGLHQDDGGADINTLALTLLSGAFSILFVRGIERETV